MAKRESVQKKLQRIRPPRVQLTYDVEVGDGKEIKELPFVVGVLGDFSAASELEKAKLKAKKFINVDLDNLDEVIELIKTGEINDAKTICAIFRAFGSAFGGNEFKGFKGFKE